MEDYTYHLGPGEPKILGAHMLEVCPTIAGDRPALRDPPAGHRRPRGPGPAGLRRRARPGGRRRPGRPRRPVPAGRQRDRGRPAGRAAAEAAGRPGGVEAGPDAPHVGRVLADRRRSAPHRAHPGGGRRDAARLRRDVGTELLLIDADTTDRRLRRPELRWNQAYYRLAQGPVSAGSRHDGCGTVLGTSTRERLGERAGAQADSPRSRAGSLALTLAACGEDEDRASGRGGGDQGGRRHHADQVLGALDPRRRQRQEAAGGRSATRSTCSTPRTTSRPRSTRSRTRSPRAPSC